MTLTISLIVGVIVLALSTRYFIRRVNQLEWRDGYRAKFFDIAGRLVDNPDTPDRVVHVLRNAAYDLNSYLFSWGIMWRLFVSTGRLRRDEAGRLRRDEEGSLTISEISELPDAHRDEIYTAVGTWMTAITYNNAILGMLVRRLAFWGLMSVNDQIQDQDQNQECAPGDMPIPALCPGHA